MTRLRSIPLVLAAFALALGIVASACSAASGTAVSVNGTELVQQGLQQLVASHRVQQDAEGPDPDHRRQRQHVHDHLHHRRAEQPGHLRPDRPGAGPPPHHALLGRPQRSRDLAAEPAGAQQHRSLHRSADGRFRRPGQGRARLAGLVQDGADPGHGRPDRPAEGVRPEAGLDRGPPEALRRQPERVHRQGLRLRHRGPRRQRGHRRQRQPGDPSASDFTSAQTEAAGVRTQIAGQATSSGSDLATEFASAAAEVAQQRGAPVRRRPGLPVQGGLHQQRAQPRGRHLERSGGRHEPTHQGLARATSWCSCPPGAT